MMPYVDDAGDKDSGCLVTRNGVHMPDLDRKLYDKPYETSVPSQDMGIRQLLPVSAC